MTNLRKLFGHNKVAILLMLLLVAALMLSACGKTDDTSKDAPKDDPKPVEQPKEEPSTGPKEGGTLYMSQFSAPEGKFNINYYESLYDGNVNDLLYDGMMSYTESLELEFNLAKDVEIAEDNLSFTFYLREDVKFHDGVGLTAHDVAFTFKNMLHPDYTGVRTSNWLLIEGAADYRAGDADDVSGIQVLDDYTIKFVLTQTDAPFFPRVATWGISAEHAFDGYAVADYVTSPAVTTKPIGTGPYKFVEYRTDQYVELVRNEDYHRGKPYIEKIIYKIVNQEVAIGQLRNGEVDFINVSADNLSMVEAMNHVNVMKWESFGYQYMGINTTHPFLSDKRVRQALAYGIDRDGIVEGLLDGQGQVLNQPFPSMSWAFNPNVSEYEYNPAKAAELLAEAGWTKDGAWLKNAKGERFEVTLKYPTGNKVRINSAVLIQENLSQLGIKVNLEIYDFPTLVTMVYTDKDFDLYLMGWSLSLDPDQTGIWGADTAWNAVQFVHPDSLRLMQEGRSVLAIEERQPIYQEWAALLNEELPYVFLYQQNDIVAINDRVKNAQPNFLSFQFNIHEWWLD